VSVFTPPTPIRLSPPSAPDYCLRARRSRSLVRSLCMRMQMEMQMQCPPCAVLCPLEERTTFLPSLAKLAAAATGLSLFQYNQCSVHYGYRPLCRGPRRTRIYSTSSASPSIGERLRPCLVARRRPIHCRCTVATVRFVFI